MSATTNFKQLLSLIGGGVPVLPYHPNKEQKTCPECLGYGVIIDSNKHCITCSLCLGHGVIYHCPECNEYSAIKHSHSNNTSEFLSQAEEALYRKACILEPEEYFQRYQGPLWLHSFYTTPDKQIFNTLEDFFNYWQTKPTSTPSPLFLWNTKEKIPSFFAQDIINKVSSPAAEEAPVFSKEEIETLEAKIEEWKKEEAQHWYEPDYSVAIKIPWERTEFLAKRKIF